MRWLYKLFILTLVLLVLVSVGVFSLSDAHLSVPFMGAQDKPSPGSWVKEDQIKVYQDRIELDIPKASWARFTNTKSMDPVFDESAHALEILPDDADAINIGDIISYRSSSGILVHRVVDKGSDEQGRYYIVKGDNAPLRDPFKVRFNEVKGVVVAVIY